MHAVLSRFRLVAAKTYTTKLFAHLPISYHNFVSMLLCVVNRREKFDNAGNVELACLTRNMFHSSLPLFQLSEMYF